ncbi:SPOR domain-containing protein [Streptomyces sp. NPDC050560]|uniref:SPOR domain-containing protein n=1 Tax=Streptomyces sp. NPDC050560 TaxID=3365630 RepID=UPI0037A339CE
MSDTTAPLVWSVIRQEENGNSYRVGSYATEEEARKFLDSLGSRGHAPHPRYVVERIG